jgi:hypothetical protein
VEKRAPKKTLAVEIEHRARNEMQQENSRKFPESVGKRSMKFRTMGNCEGAIRERIGNATLNSRLPGHKAEWIKKCQPVFHISA